MPATQLPILSVELYRTVKEARQVADWLRAQGRRVWAGGALVDLGPEEGLPDHDPEAGEPEQDQGAT